MSQSQTVIVIERGVDGESSKGIEPLISTSSHHASDFVDFILRDGDAMFQWPVLGIPGDEGGMAQQLRQLLRSPPRFPNIQHRHPAPLKQFKLQPQAGFPATHEFGFPRTKVPKPAETLNHEPLLKSRPFLSPFLPWLCTVVIDLLFLDRSQPA